MVVFETNAREYICDAPPCKVRRLATGDDEPIGALGTARMSGMADQSWFACEAAHIRPAIEYVTTPVYQLPDAVREMTQWKRDLAEARELEDLANGRSCDPLPVTRLSESPVFE